MRIESIEIEIKENRWCIALQQRYYFRGSEAEDSEDCETFFTTNLGIKLFQSIYPGDNGELICDKHPITTQGGFNLHLYTRVGPIWIFFQIGPTLIFYFVH